jgi:hypothetical protein
VCGTCLAYGVRIKEMRCVGHVSHMGERKNTQKILVS